MRQNHVDHAYAHTSHKEQGVTTHREIFLVRAKGAHWLNREASYVAASRAKQNMEIVATEEAYDKMLQNAGKNTQKTTAIDIGNNRSLEREQVNERLQAPAHDRHHGRSKPELEL
jgi:ATP-dependent exoDNAse (exonuclease V) alpha subunit